MAGRNGTVNVRDDMRSAWRLLGELATVPKDKRVDKPLTEDKVRNLFELTEWEVEFDFGDARAMRKLMNSLTGCFTRRGILGSISAEVSGQYNWWRQVEHA